MFMCSVGGPMADLDLKKTKIRKYKCSKCGKEFKVLSGNAKCPECKSTDLAEIK